MSRNGYGLSVSRRPFTSACADPAAGGGKIASTKTTGPHDRGQGAAYASDMSPLPVQLVDGRRVRALTSISSRDPSGESQAQADGNAEGAADATVLGRLAQARQLRAVERALEDQLRVDADDPALGLRGAEPGLEPLDRPLLAFGEPPNVRELSGADGAEEHLGRRRALVSPPGFARGIQHHSMRPDRGLRLHACHPPHRHPSRHAVLLGHPDRAPGWGRPAAPFGATAPRPRERFQARRRSPSWRAWCSSRCCP